MKVGKLILEGTNCCEDYEWEDLNYMVPGTKFKTGHFYCEVNGFGWRSLDGEKYCKADNMVKLLCEVLPKTECNFKIYNYGRGLAINNTHHDSATGAEWYYIKPITEGSYNRRK